jgi:hypothetical protein
MIGKPYSGKPNVRFDERELEIELLATTPALYSTEICDHRLVQVAQHSFYDWFWSIINSIKRTFCFSKDFSLTLQDLPAGNGTKNLPSHSAFSSMILLYEKMDPPAQYREKPSLGYLGK